MEEKIKTPFLGELISSEFVSLGAMVVDFQRTVQGEGGLQGGPRERGIAIMEHEGNVHLIVDVKGQPVTEVWNFDQVPYEGCFMTNVEVFG